ncbi:hypothetical protein [Brucella intermedia]|uniref:hypothetical protein n=1 Tax=Brucella intermedia TaxID=94625 RepID=UPI000EFCEC09|nr:hypothetical protein [Brucella intermedia]KAB2720377.1 hypothetical protein F9K75_04715 [Brucella intermedia]
MTFLETIFTVTVKVPVEYMTEPQRPWFSLFSHLHAALIGVGVDPMFATVLVAASPIFAISLVAQISASFRDWCISRRIRRQSSLDDDWADIAVQLAEETKSLGLGESREAFCASFAPSGDQSENEAVNAPAITETKPEGNPT